MDYFQKFKMGSSSINGCIVSVLSMIILLGFWDESDGNFIKFYCTYVNFEYMNIYVTVRYLQLEKSLKK